MTSRLLISALCAAFLASCSHYGQFSVPDPTGPQIVLLPNGYLVVNQEPIVVARQANEPTVITWRLAPDSGLTFDNSTGIVILARIKDTEHKPLLERDLSQNKLFDCKLGEAAGKGAPPNPLVFHCTVPLQISRGLYAYAINTTDKRGVRISLDPTIMI